MDSATRERFIRPRVAALFASLLATASLAWPGPALGAEDACRPPAEAWIRAELPWSFRAPNAVAVSPEGEAWLLGCHRSSPRSPASETGCRGQRFSKSGEAVGGESRLLQGWHCRELPEAAFLADGSVVVACSGESPVQGGGLRVVAQRIAPDGRAGVPFQVAEAPLVQQDPQVVPLRDGGFWLLWVEQAEVSRAGTVRGLRFGPEGARPEGEPVVLSPSGIHAGGSFSAAEGPLGLLIAWSGTSPHSGRAREVFLRRLGADGKLTEPLRLSDEKPRPIDPNLRPRVAVDAHGEVLVAWTRGSRARARFVSQDLQPRGGEFLLSGEPEGEVNGSDFQPRVAPLGGGFAAVWLRASPREEEHAAAAQIRALTPPEGGEAKVRTLLDPVRWDRPIAAIPTGTSLAVFGVRLPGPRSVEVIACRIPAP